MKKLGLISLLLWTSVVCGLPGLAEAQTVGAPSSVDQRYTQSAPKSWVVVPEDNAALTGRNDLMILRRPAHFNLHGGIYRAQTSNVALSPDDPTKDSSTNYNLGIGISTKIDNRINLFADIGAMQVKYSSEKALDFAALNATLGASARVSGMDISLTYQPALIYDGKFQKQQLRQRRYAATLNVPLRVKKWQVEPNFHADRVFATPADYNSRAVGYDLTVSRSFATKFPVSVYVTTGFEKRAYDNYYRDFLGTDRRDKKTETSMGVQMQLTPWADITARATTTRNLSTSDVNGYTSNSAFIGISVHRSI